MLSGSRRGRQGRWRGRSSLTPLVLWRFAHAFSLLAYSSTSPASTALLITQPRVSPLMGLFITT